MQYNSAGPNPVLSAPEMPDFDPNAGPAPAATGGAATGGPTRWLFFDSETDEPGTSIHPASFPLPRPVARLPLLMCVATGISLSRSFLLSTTEPEAAQLMVETWPARPENAQGKYGDALAGTGAGANNGGGGGVARGLLLGGKGAGAAENRPPIRQSSGGLSAETRAIALGKGRA